MFTRLNTILLLTIAAMLSVAPTQVRAFDIQAHRGGRALLPENTLPAFARALSLGVNTLELDLGVTKDGVVVVSHDRRLNPDLVRGLTGNYVQAPGEPLTTLTASALEKYDVGQIRPGSAYAAAFPEQQLVSGARIPTLAQVFALVRKSGDDQVRLNIETKIDPTYPDETVDPERFVALLVDLVRREGFRDRVTIQSFDWRTLQRVQQQAPEIPTVYLSIQQGSEPTVLVDRASPWTAGFNPSDHGGSIPRTIKVAGGSIWSPYHGDLTPEALKEAHSLGLRVIVWTVNDAADMARLIVMGVDGIISDRPDVLRHVARNNGVILPSPAPVSP